MYIFGIKQISGIKEIIIGKISENNTLLLKCQFELHFIFKINLYKNEWLHQKLLDQTIENRYQKFR